MNTTVHVLAAPDPDPRRRLAPGCTTREVVRPARRRRCERSLASTLVDRIGGPFVGGRMGTTFGHL
jgi:hypothetical protein